MLPRIQLTSWDFPAVEGDADIDAVALEMNGVNLETNLPIQSSAELKSDGTTICGCRLLAGFINKEGNNLMKRREPGEVDHELDLTYRVSWPTNTRILL